MKNGGFLVGQDVLFSKRIRYRHVNSIGILNPVIDYPVALVAPLCRVAQLLVVEAAIVERLLHAGTSLPLPT